VGSALNPREGLFLLIATQAAICFLSARARQLCLQAVTGVCMQADKLLLAEMRC